MQLSQFSTLTFDCYGTLIDWESGLYKALQPLLERAGKTFNRQACLELFRQAEAPVQEQNSAMLYSNLLATVHRQIASDLMVDTDTAMDNSFAHSIKDWPAFPDSVDSLKYLKQHYKLVILSNVDRAGFAHSNCHLEIEFDAVYTAEDIGSYKPCLGNFHYMLKHLKDMGIDQSEILHTAQSLYHDMLPATSLGLKTCWIDRRAGQEGSGATPSVSSKVEVDRRFVSLAEMVATHQAEMTAS